MDVEMQGEKGKKGDGRLYISFKNLIPKAFNIYAGKSPFLLVVAKEVKFW